MQLKLGNPKSMKDTTLPTLPFYERKAQYFAKHKSFRKRKKWIKANYPKRLKRKVKHRRRIKRIANLRIPLKYLSFLRWMIVDFLRCKDKKFWGIYGFVALPGEGKTMSMVGHMERARKENPNVYIACNFKYAHADVVFDGWVDMIEAAVFALEHKRRCIIAVDEIHLTFDSADWQSFPPEMLALLSLNRKYNLQFLCTSQIYDRIPKKVRDITNYVVICKNVLGADRLFVNYYFHKVNYDEGFNGKRKHAHFIRDFIADDKFYSLFDTKERIKTLAKKAQEEKSEKERAFKLLFGNLDKPKEED